MNDAGVVQPRALHPPSDRRYAIIIPACDEEESLPRVLDELISHVGDGPHAIVVGVNGTTDRTAEVARDGGAHVAETHVRGYGRGCQAAIELARRELGEFDGYIFLSGDGANDPRDIAALIDSHRQGSNLVLGCRTRSRKNLAAMGWTHLAANRFLGLWCGLLTGRLFRDVGPLRLIDRRLFERMALREWTFGWTIEAQVTACRLRETVREVPVRERPRLAGQQKVSRVSALRTLRIGWAILVAGWRARFRPLPEAQSPRTNADADSARPACRN